MRPHTILATALILAAPALHAQVPADTPQARGVFPRAARFQNADMHMLQKGYVRCFAAENDGVVESAIAQVVRMRLARPDAPMKDIRAALAQLSQAARTPAIRYKAYLAELAFDCPAMFVDVRDENFESYEQFYASLTSRVQSELIGRAGTE